MDLFPNEQNFDLDKSRQKFHHSLKEHHKISNISKFCCEMLQNADNIALQYTMPKIHHRFVKKLQRTRAFYTLNHCFENTCIL
jgi:hypothetical protein